MYRQTALVAVLVVVMGCGSEPKPLGVVGHVGVGFGGAVADEPAAALIARDVLSAGGTAADAAVALYFGLAVTYPVAAALGGGGKCIVHAGDSAKAEVLDFAPASSSPDEGGLSVPANVRGMAALHARYGRLRWTQLVQPAERAARFGNRISRALVRATRPEAGRLVADPAVRGTFLRRDGSPLEEGDRIEQVSLATTIGRIRARGGGALYGGTLASRFETGAAAIGKALPVEALRRWTPVWRETTQLEFGNHTVALVAGSQAARLWKSSFRDDVYIAATANGSPANSASSLSQVPDAGTSGFTVMDRLGGAVACAFTMNGPYGTGRIIPGTGVFAAPPPPAGDKDDSALAIIFNANSGNAYLAISSTGGPGAAAELTRVSGAVLGKEAPLKDAISDGRDGASRVNVIYCPEGIQRKVDLCRYQSDPRGFGHAVSAER